MDTTRWKSVIVPRDVYDEIVAVAYIEGRTIGGQLRMTFDYWKRQNLSKNDMAVLSDMVEKNKQEEQAAEDAAIQELVDREIRDAVNQSVEK